MPAKHKTVDEYLAPLPDDKRAALERLRKIIRSAAPEAEECISYGVPSYKFNGYLVGFAAAAKHCSFYPGGRPVEYLKADLKAYDISKGTIRFQPDKPLPVALVKKLVKIRLAQNAGKSARVR